MGKNRVAKKQSNKKNNRKSAKHQESSMVKLPQVNSQAQPHTEAQGAAQDEPEEHLEEVKDILAMYNDLDSLVPAPFPPTPSEKGPTAVEHFFRRDAMDTPLPDSPTLPLSQAVVLANSVEDSASSSSKTHSIPSGGRMSPSQYATLFDNEPSPNPIFEALQTYVPGTYEHNIDLDIDLDLGLNRDISWAINDLCDSYYRFIRDVRGDPTQILTYLRHIICVEDGHLVFFPDVHNPLVGGGRSQRGVRIPLHVLIPLGVLLACPYWIPFILRLLFTLMSLPFWGISAIFGGVSWVLGMVFWVLSSIVSAPFKVVQCLANALRA
ncbi:MAG: hypothetical protein Q9160_003592 [Pyrenula sp. 1 TL-2023]